MRMPFGLFQPLSHIQKTECNIGHLPNWPTNAMGRHIRP